MDLRIAFTRRALRDLEEIRNYFYSLSPKGAESVSAGIVESCERLSYFPRMGKKTRIPSVHAIQAGRFPFFIFYRLAGDAIEIIHIRHASREPWRGLN